MDSLATTLAYFKGSRSVTPNTALRLSSVLGMPRDFWLGLQQDWDLWHAMNSPEANRSIA